MRVGVADAFSMQATPTNEIEYLTVLCLHCRRKVIEEFQNPRAVAQAAEGDFSNHERMLDDLATFERFDEPIEKAPGAFASFLCVLVRRCETGTWRESVVRIIGCRPR